MKDPRGRESPAASGPPRVIGAVSAFAIVAGSMLGVGIFLFPGQMALSVSSGGSFLALWLLGGLMALSGAVACGELGAMMPRAGGDYVFQRAAFGPSVAFAGGCVLFGAVFAGSMASLSVAVFQYQVSALLGVGLGEIALGPAGISASRILAAGLILALTALNVAGVRPASALQTLATFAPIAFLVLLALIAPFAAVPGAELDRAHTPAAESLTGLTSGFLLVYFAYSGWPNVIYVAGEVRDPGVNVPRSMILAVLAVTALYLLLCAAFLAVLGMGGLAALGAGWLDAGTGLARALGSPFVERVVLVTIALAILTSVNATVLAGARVAYAMAVDGAFPLWAAKLDARSGVPSRALWIQCALACLFVLTGTFDAIVEMTSLAMLVTGSLTVASLFVLRRSEPDRARPYRAHGYPVLPACYLVLALVVFGTELREAVGGEGVSALYPLVGLAVLVLAFAAHRLWRVDRGLR
jgi:APA family basic amino acid/polyamine antiporter